jgi:RNA polymerase sigma factor (sigma-70 family)
MTAVPATLRLRREGVLRSRAARGDAAAFAAVYERHHQALYRYCRSILRHEEDAQDALQSTFARAFAALQDERRDFELKPWLFRIAHNEAISILRRRRETSELADVPGEEGETEQRVSEREELRMLRYDLADLPDRQRSALVLRELNGLSHTEIGAVLDLSPSAVKQSIFEARTALFSCREGREMPCHDVRRMLSDGDGRVLRGRGVRAHLRSCPECRRFKRDLAQRPAALRMLAPPLPTAGAAALLGELLGGSTAKLLACVAIAGSGTTIAAVEMRDAPGPVRQQAEAGSRARPAPAPKRAVPIVPVATSAPQHTTPTRLAPVEQEPRQGKPARRPKAVRPKVKRDNSPEPRATTAPGQAKRAEKEPPPGQVKRAERKPPPGQVKRAERKPPPGQVKRAEKEPPPGQVKRAEKEPPPGQVKRAEKEPPPGQVKQAEQEPPPGRANNAAAAPPADEAPLNTAQAGKPERE